MERRRFLAVVGATSVAGLGGCTGDDGGGGTTPATATRTETGTETDGGEDVGGGAETEGREESTSTRTCLPLGIEPALSFLRGRTVAVSGDGSDRALALPAGATSTITLFVHDLALPDVDVDGATLDAPWPVEKVRRPVVGLDDPRTYAVGQWELAVPASAGGEDTITASATTSFSCQQEVKTVDQRVRISPVLSAPYGFNAGGGCDFDDWARIDGLWFDNGVEDGAGAAYVDVSGGASPTDTAVDLACSDAEIVATEHDALYRTAHVGGNLGYEVAIENGTYDVTLYFAENDETVEPGDRVFDVAVQGTDRLEAFDVADGTEVYHAPVTRTVEGVEVTDESLSVTTASIEGNSMCGGFLIREA